MKSKSYPDVLDFWEQFASDLEQRKNQFGPFMRSRIHRTVVALREDIEATRRKRKDQRLDSAGRGKTLH